MPPISERERATYDDVWGLSNYAAFSPGEHYLAQFLDMTGGAHMRGRVLDAGCGSGKGALALQAAGFDVTLCDITNAGLVPEAQHLPFLRASLWHDLRAAHVRHGWRWPEWVYCTDVLEHVPTALTMLVAQRLIELARKGVFFSISLVPDRFGVMVGHPLHQTVQPFTWWRDHLREIGTVVECRDLIATGLYLVRAQ